MRFTSPNRNETPTFELSPTFGGLGMQPAQMSDMNSNMPSQYMMQQPPHSGGVVSLEGCLSNNKRTDGEFFFSELGSEPRGSKDILPCKTSRSDESRVYNQMKRDKTANKGGESDYNRSQTTTTDLEGSRKETNDDTLDDSTTT